VSIETRRDLRSQAEAEIRAARQSLAHGHIESVEFWLGQLEKSIAAYEALYTDLKRRKAS
jgi:hypothetical protein